MENWHDASAASKGTMARHYPYQRVLGFENPPDVVPGLGTDAYNEPNQRGRYRRWAQAGSWAGLAAPVSPLPGREGARDLAMLKEVP